MSELSFFDYAFIRVIPYVERGEFINAGVILFCRTRRFLDAQVELNPQRLLALAPNCDPDDIQHHIEGIPRICAGGAAAGPIGELTQAERFHWLVAPRSTIIQPSPVHTGRTADPAATLQHLFETIIHI
ncbi:MAG: DUF3037 domain-containing protein [Chloroflexi bacterium AL-W]|nr:DUF3037 domain-containing protein [Chloroflexi bacterium AL-N1]NOK64872.1 DUF3037 domain-containing protein [Chloroflexi bacterium AL-N10]NOK76642.1 DUF3037 domain-containing protein [Chloroflexi bacterium AL-N5]NOK80129.1 DUF3037 domain-containing protein [Chloroflexi bacterium AL-W]NOK86642.1 DUF3037 domain-containing protein [Chloroflexi bacterium AL-N15]